MNKLLKMLCLTDEATTESALAHPLTITANSNRYLNDYQIYGSSVQEGNPSPDAPIEVQSVGDLVTEGEYAGKYRIPVTVTCGEATKTTDIYLDAPLRKIGDYADYIDFKGKKVVRNVQELTFTGEESYTFLGVGTTYERIIYSVTALNAKPSTPSLCNAIKTTTSSDKGWNGKEFIIHLTTDIRFYRPSYSGALPEVTTASAWKSFLAERYSSGNPVILYCVYDTPMEESVALPALPQFKGEAIYTAQTTITPGGLQVKYY